MSLPWLLILVLWYPKLSEARPQPEKLSPAIVVGTLYCDTCFQDDFAEAAQYISGAVAAVECEKDSSRPGFYQEVKTNKEGKFKVHLPFSVRKDIKGCTLKLLKNSDPNCAVTVKKSSVKNIHFKETEQGKHIFSVGFKPSKNPTEKCNQKLYKNSFFQNYPQMRGIVIPKPYLPSLPKLPPLPQLPPLPPLPSLPQLPNIPSLNSIIFPNIPANPLQMSASVLPPPLSLIQGIDPVSPVGPEIDSTP